MSWFKQHLNWSLIIIWFVPALLLIPLLNTVSDTNSFLNIYMTVYGLAILVVSGWVLKQKGRSLFNLFWLVLSWIGIIIILCLENRAGNRVVQEETENTK